MSQLTLADLLGALQASVHGLESRAGTDVVPVQELERAKLLLDDIRLSLWAHLQRLHAADVTTFEQQFRVRRAVELCSRLKVDLDAQLLDPTRPEFTDLWIVATDLSRSIQAKREQGQG